MVNLKGATAFLCCGGMSLVEHDLSLLSGHGILVAAVNNAPVAMWRNGRVRPHLWFSVDSPRCFHHDIFLDPACQKFVRRLHCDGDQHYGQGRREQWRASRNDVRMRHEGRWVAWKPANEFPNVELYDAYDGDTFDLQSFFKYTSPPWRSEKMCSVMLPALWFLVRMGVSTINLIGCDLSMDVERPYPWEQGKSVKAVAEENVCLTWLRNSALPALIDAAYGRGTIIRRLTPGELPAAVRGVRETIPFQFAGDLYTTE